MVASNSPELVHLIGAVQAQLELTSAHTGVVIGAAAPDLVTALLGMPGQWRHISAVIHLPELAPPPPKDAFGILLLDEHVTDQAVGAACRAFPHRLLALDLTQAGTLASAPTEGPAVPLDGSRFFAFGFRRVLARTPEDVPIGTTEANGPVLYDYSLRHYKPVPDWLNSRYWAHPERFDLVDDESS